MLSFFVIASCAPSVRFSVTDDSYTTGRNTAKLKVLTDSATGSRVSVLLNGGGGVDELFLAPAADPRTEGKNTSLREVIWSHGLNATSAIENPTWKGRMLLPYANRIGNASYVFNGSSYQLPVNDVAGLHNALHGLLWDRTMVPVASHADNTGASVTLAYEFNTGRPATRATGYPFKLAVRITYSLGLGENGGTSFDAEVQASNIDPTGWPLPFYNGWHPYFLCHPCSEAYIVLDKTAQWAHVDVGVGPRFPPPRYSNMVGSQASLWCGPFIRDTLGFTRFFLFSRCPPHTFHRGAGATARLRSERRPARRAHPNTLMMR